MNVKAVIRGMDVVKVTGASEHAVTGITADSRHVQPGYVFVAVGGHQRDGWAYAAEAIQRGAVAVVAEHPPVGKPAVCHVQVDNARRAVAHLAAAFHDWPSRALRLVGITGTNGKTTVAYLARDLMAAQGLRPGLVGTVEYRIGERSIPAARTTPDAASLQAMLAEMVGVGCRSAVMEVSSHALVQERVGGIEFDIGVFTNLTRDHLDYHGDMASYFEAKRLLFRALGTGGKTGRAVVNIDDPWGRKLADDAGIVSDIVTYGMDAGAAVRAESIRLTADGTRFHVRTPWGEAELQTCLLGRFNVSNVLAALAVGGCLEIPPADMAHTLADVSRVAGRLEEVPTGRGFHVFVDYAHTDDALQNVLETLREITERRLIVVFGCGGNRDLTKRPAMGRVAERLADYTVITSDNPRKEEPGDIIRQVLAGFESSGCVETVEARETAIARALDLAQPGDVVVIAGKGHETFQEFANRTVPFDDRQIVKKLLASG